LTRSRALAVRSRDTALLGAAWTAEKTRVITRASVAGASKGGAWTRGQAAEITRKLQQGRSIASPWLRAKTHGTADRLLALRAAAAALAGRQWEQAAFLAVRLNAQAKGEIDALKRAARDGRLAPPGWDKVSAIAFARKDSVNGLNGEGQPSARTAEHAGAEADFATSHNGGHASRALICVEPWRCRLPVVKSDRLGDQFLMGAVRRAPTEASRSS
jgi:hypothetical protein